MNALVSYPSKEDIQRRANQVLEKHKRLRDPVLLLQAIARDEDIELKESDLYDISGILKKEDGKWAIYVNREDSLTRKLFTIAHELGHYFMHRDEEDQFVDSLFIMRDEEDKYTGQELEANEFAGSLIMPEARLRDYLDDRTPREEDVVQLAKKFNVSPLAMVTRLRNLGYHVLAAEE
ncbi:MAG: ribosomal protein [Candidatus Peribacteria bacterium]|nr:ribosomal protein [Candidatus Peribacteria bacterium]